MDKFCRNCGNKIKEGAKFCANCGEPVTMPEPQKPMCAYCGAELKETSKFCPKCGKPVGDSATVAVPVQSTAPPAQSIPTSQAEKSAAQHGIYVAKPKGTGSIEPAKPNMPQPTIKQSADKPKKSVNPKKVMISLVAVIMVVVLLVTGLISPAWMKGNKAKIKSVYKDNSYVDITLPKQSKAMDYTLAVESMALKAQLNAMLREEKFYRAVDKGKSPEKLNKLLKRSKKAWEEVDKLSSAAYVMSYALYETEKSSGKSNKAAIGNPFIMSAYAADKLHMDRFDDAKQWAEYITEVYDHAKTNKVAYVAKLLKTDTKRAREAINMAQNILKQETGNNDYVDTEIIKAIKVTKAAGKVSGLILAGIATGGASMGVLSTTGFVASGIDTVIETTNAGMILTFGEDHQITKRFESDTSKIAPIISIASLANVTSWGNAADVLGNVRYIVDCGAENYTEGKILGIQLSSKPENKEATEVKVFKLPIGKDMTDKDKEKLSEVLENMGFDKTAIDEAIAEITKPDKTEATETPDAVEKKISELSDKELDEKIEETSFEQEDYDKLFDELFDSFKEEMENEGDLPDDDYIWDYDPEIPPEDLPQPGDEDGDWDDPSKWSKPEKPFEEPEETATVKDDSKDDDLPVLRMLAGKYMGSEVYRAKTEKSYTEHLSEDMGREIVYKDGKLYWFGIELDYDPETGTATGDNKNEKYEAEHVDLEFKEVNGELHLHFVNTKQDVTRTFDGVKVDDALARLEGKYAGSCKVLRYYPDRTETSQESAESVRVRINGNIVPIPSNFGHGQAFDKESIKWDKSAKKGSATADDGEYEVEWYFEESGGKIKLYLDVYDLALIKTTNMDSKYDKEYHFELTMSE